MCLPMIEYRASEALPVDGKPSWYGQYRRDAGLWRTAASLYGMIRYTTPEAALAGARVYAVEREAREGIADISVHDRPCAAPGLTSYRARGRWGWIMIGARDDADARREALRSSDRATDLQVWDGKRYVPCAETLDTSKCRE